MAARIVRGRQERRGALTHMFLIPIKLRDSARNGPLLYAYLRSWNTSAGEPPHKVRRDHEAKPRPWLSVL